MEGDGARKDVKKKEKKKSELFSIRDSGGVAFETL